MCYHTGCRDPLERLYPASNEVLRNQDLLKRILYLAYKDDNLGTPKINELRVISRTWKSLIDSSELLQNISYQTRHEQGSLALCWKYLEELRSAARDVRAIRIDDAGIYVPGKEEFEAFAEPMSRSSSISNIHLTKPALQVVYLCFQGFGSREFVSNMHMESIIRPDDLWISNPVTSGTGFSFKYYHRISTDSGVRSHQVIQSFIDLIRKFYSFQRVFTIISVAIEYEASKPSVDIKQNNFLPNFDRLFDLWQSRKIANGIPTSSIALLMVASPFIAFHGAIKTAQGVIGL
ncbi:hypothetical protein TWF192_011175 [Orbilia oligospora]|uniref:Uncharacterized protein n=1 Tax=Orbilia oligospora TaxID=2813651 RepID=A0A6G1MJA5_ORBOL|nr:hypothetical protein TWF191_007261 [Orbilia oligospora]KAF3259042.1 hypothetical protein TWF192_011175 [Orbilia oligospora]